MENPNLIANSIIAIIKELSALVGAIGIIVVAFLQWQAKRAADKRAERMELMQREIGVITHQTNSINTALLARSASSDDKLLAVTAKAAIAEGKEEQRVTQLEAVAAAVPVAPIMVEIAPGAKISGVVTNPDTDVVEGNIKGKIEAPKK